jgi:hypothetical protein
LQLPQERGLSRKEKNIGGEPIQVIIHTSVNDILYSYLNQKKMSFFPKN